MNDTNKLALSELLNVSRRLAECATDGNWDNVQVLETEQRTLLARFFSGNDSKPLTAETLTDLTNVCNQTNMVLELAKQKRTLLVSAADKIQTGQTAVNAYAQCT